MNLYVQKANGSGTKQQEVSMIGAPTLEEVRLIQPKYILELQVQIQC